VPNHGVMVVRVKRHFPSALMGHKSALLAALLGIITWNYFLSFVTPMLNFCRSTQIVTAVLPPKV
jgi:hypothetical protein